jgi:hypothetical protein
MKNILTAVLISSTFLLTACDVQSSSREQNARSAEDNQLRLMKVIPAPQLNTSLERANLAERLQRINQQNMSGFIYLLSYGRVVASYPIRGKVTSLNAYLTQGETPCSIDGRMCETPDYDGAYGKNAEGVFFFTADSNAYVEWAGDYLFSDQPLRLNQEPMMVRNVGDQK